VKVVGQLLLDVFRAGVADEGDVMAKLAAPGAVDLRHDAGHVGVHEAGEPRARGTARDDVHYADAKFAHAISITPLRNALGQT